MDGGADWHSQDIFSYNVEQARGDTHNMICVVMQEQALDLQTAVDFVGYVFYHAPPSSLPYVALQRHVQAVYRPLHGGA
jgi:hypothetical protein